MRLGSRPARRPSGSAAAGASIGSLRAIPWVFAWSQVRLGLPGWFGLGSALDRFRSVHGDAGLDRLAQLYRAWPFFESILDNAELALARVDLPTARAYRRLDRSPGVGRGVGRDRGRIRAGKDAPRPGHRPGQAARRPARQSSDRWRFERPILIRWPSSRSTCSAGCVTSIRRTPGRPGAAARPADRECDRGGPPGHGLRATSPARRPELGQAT